ncbi:phosphate system positive regulatory protein pho81, partial [Rhizopus azygosporus]
MEEGVGGQRGHLCPNACTNKRQEMVIVNSLSTLLLFDRESIRKTEKAVRHQCMRSKIDFIMKFASVILQNVFAANAKLAIDWKGSQQLSRLAGLILLSAKACHLCSRAEYLWGSGCWQVAETNKASVQQRQLPQFCLEINRDTQKKRMKFISSLLNAPADSLKALGLPPIDDEDRSKLLQSQKAAFFFKLERELEKINSFYLQKENELKVRLRTLIDKKKVLQSDTRRLKHASTLFKAIQEAFIQFEQELTKIQKYVELNNEGFRKILKKWDKRSKSSTKELYLSRQIDIQPCFNTQVLCELSDMASANRIELSNIQEGIPISPASWGPHEMNNTSGTTGTNLGGGTGAVDEMDDIELELVKSVSAGQVSVVREILDRITQNPAPEDRGRITRVFWHACSEASKEIVDMLINTHLVDFDYVDDIIERSCLHVVAMN